MSFRERRAAERTWGAYRDALLSIPRLKHVHSCRVRDLSNEGAGLHLNGLPLLPSEFHLSLDGFHTTLACRSREMATSLGRIPASVLRPLTGAIVVSPDAGGTCIWKVRARNFFPLGMSAGCTLRRPPEGLYQRGSRRASPITAPRFVPAPSSISTTRFRTIRHSR